MNHRQSWITVLLGDRIRRPFTSAFIFAWIFINWRFWVGLIKIDTSKYTFSEYLNELADTLSFPDKTIIIPLLSALTIPLILNLFNKYYDEIKEEFKTGEINKGL